MSDNESLQTQNEELRVLLHQYVTMEVNKDLQGNVRSTFKTEADSSGGIILNNSDPVLRTRLSSSQSCSQHPITTLFAQNSTFICT